MQHRTWRMEDHWTAIVVTCSTAIIREGLEKECSRLAKVGLLPSHELLMVVDDPQWEKISKEESASKTCRLEQGVGSGGATINALLVAVERLSAKRNHTTISSELVYNSRFLVVHHGRVLAHSPGGSPFLYVPPELACVSQRAMATPPTLLQHVIWMATKVGRKSNTGVWVTSLDAFIPNSPQIQAPDTDGVNGAVVCTIKTPFQQATHHGTVITDGRKNILRMEYKMPLDRMKEVFMKDEAPVISGLVFLSASLTEQLLGLHTLPPLDRCTYYGTDSGIPPLQVSLYFDLLLPLCSGVEEKEYLSGQCGAMYAQVAKYDITAVQELHTARLQIWKQLQGLKAVFHSLEGTRHHYLASHLTYESIILPLLAPSCVGNSHLHVPTSGAVKTINAYIEGSVKSTGKDLFIVDSWIGKDVALECSGLSTLSGFQLPCARLQLQLAGDCVWQMHPTSVQDVITCYGIKDQLSLHYQEKEAKIFNTDWPVFMKRTGLSPDILWPNQASHHQTFLTAKLFSNKISKEEQIQSLAIMVKTLTDDISMSEWKSRIEEWKVGSRISLLDAIESNIMHKLIKQHEDIYLKIAEQIIEATSSELGGKSLLPVFEYIAASGQISVNKIMTVLHQQLNHERPTTPRLLANIADLLGCMAAGDGGLRSGPAANPQWRNALQQLKLGNQSGAMELMFDTCKSWMQSGHPEDLIRAARHYERASQIVISHLVETAEMHVSPMWVAQDLRQQVPVGVWVEALSPARIDLAGGWTDTPPICYEQGGAVLNIAIKINKKKPIGARVRFIPEPHIVCVLRDWSGGDVRLTWSQLEQLGDYDNPVAPGALVKVVLLYCRLVDLHSEDTLMSQLNERYNAGVEVEVWSQLPQGSGLGGSSLLAGTLVSAMAVLLGHPPPSHSHLVHATLTIEQRLTTGGGWQDQVGGLVGGAKLGVSNVGTPVTVNMYKIPLPAEMLDFLNNHLLLLYTGKVRLARNLLQTVIRNWYARDSTIIECFSKLQRLAIDAAAAVLEGDRKELGHCIDKYWSLKKMVASGCEPGKVMKLMSSLKNHCLGMSLAGAGGGGYLYALKTLSNPLPSDVIPEELSIDAVEIDQEGLELWVGGEALQTPDNEEILTAEKLRSLQ